MQMDWDKLKVFHAAAEAGSFTHAGEQLGLSQSAVSRQVSALEQELTVSLFHRHARGLILTEQGELLYRTAHDVFMKLEAARAKLTDSRERPNGDLRVTTTPGIGVHWLTPRLGEFVDLYPEVHITLLTTDEELDLAMREADVAIRLRQPTQPDLIQRKLFSVHFHVYASPEYLKKFGTPRALEDLDSHRILVLGGNVPPYLQRSRWYRIIWSRRTAGWCNCSAKPKRPRSTLISSIPKSSKASPACRRSATFWSPTRSAGIFRVKTRTRPFNSNLPKRGPARERAWLTCLVSRCRDSGRVAYFRRSACLPVAASSQTGNERQAVVPLWK
jgi:DNA-binding transcriptional LysR family regulator